MDDLQVQVLLHEFKQIRTELTEIHRLLIRSAAMEEERFRSEVKLLIRNSNSDCQK